MARALFVRLRDFVRFVWGRTKQTVSWLNINLSQHTTLRRLSYAGQGAAFMALLSAALSDGHGISPAQASDHGAATNIQASFIPYDFTSFFIVLAVALLVMTNLTMWRQRKDLNITKLDITKLDTTKKDAKNSDEPSRSQQSAPLSAKSEHTLSSDIVLARSIDLERQCQKLAQIADLSHRKSIETKLNCRVQEERLARICHDLRTPLNAVIGFSDLMRREMFGPLGHDKYMEYAEHIGDSGHNLLNAVDDIFEMTSAQIDEPSVPNSDTASAPTIITQPTDDQNIRAPEAAE